MGLSVVVVSMGVGVRRVGIRKWGALVLSSWLVGCQSTAPLPSGPTPATLSATADPDVKGRVFTWGGSVLRVKNLADRTLVEVMAYPLDGESRPRTGGHSLGRFIADYKGFLEPAEYAVGRQVTVTGPLLGYMDGKVGEADYRYPVLQADEIRLWRDAARTWSRPAISIGVGVGGGSHDGWGNIGIGFGF